MFIFSVKDMYACDSAVAIVKAVMSVDESASVYINMARHGVEITPGTAGLTTLSDAIVGAGFTPELMPIGITLPRTGQAPARIPFSEADRDFTPGELH